VIASRIMAVFINSSKISQFLTGKNFREKIATESFSLMLFGKIKMYNVVAGVLIARCVFVRTKTILPEFSFRKIKPRDSV